MAKTFERIKDTSNVAIMNAIRNSAGGDFANRINPVTQAEMRETSAQIMGHQATYNQFLDQLVNRIGSVIVRNNSWTNPLAEFKRGMMTHGDTIEEINVGLVKANDYNGDREYLEKAIFGQETPHVEANFHKVNRQEFYKISVNEAQLRQAFLSDDGLYDFTSRILDAPLTSDNFDEFMLMCSLFPQYEANGGYHRINVPDVRNMESGSSDAKQTLRKIRAMAEKLTFPSTKYNASGMYTQAKRDDLVLFGTPDFFASVDVEALSGAFNLEKMSAGGRQVTIPEEHFGMDGAQAILTTRDFFVVADQKLENTQAANPVGLHHNYFLHHWSVISQSRFAPAVLFHTGADDSAPIVINPVTGVSAITVYTREGETVAASAAQARGTVLVADATAQAASGDPSISAIRWSLTGNNDPRTRITQQGTIHIGGRETASPLTIKAVSAFIDPNDPDNRTEHSRTRTVTVDLESPAIPPWPNVDRPGDQEEPEEEEQEAPEQQQAG